jgi:heme/copper-type cytochrome/quinol oxidase subunit 2
MKKTITKQQQSNGISFAGLLFLLFLGLKLGGVGQVANWSWWWVTAPLWGGIALYLSIVIGLILLGITGVIFMSLVKYIYKKFKSEPVGYLNITSIPVSKVVLDGKVLGSTPKVKVKVTPGAHQIKFVNNDGVKGELSVLVVAGQTLTVEHKF